MSNAIIALIAVVWLSLIALGAVVLVQRSPKRRKPVDELEAADAALRQRVVTLEDNFERHVKRDAVRAGRAVKEDAQTELGLTDSPQSRLAAVRARLAQRMKGV